MVLTPNDIIKNLRNSFPSKTKVLKIAVFGDSGVGKTSLVKRFVAEKFEKNYSMTIGGDFASKNIPINSKKSISLLFSDVAGQERFEETSEVFFAGSEIGFAVFDLTRKDSLQNLVKRWIPQFVQSLDPDSKIKPKVQLMGNKSDLEDFRVISDEEIQEYSGKIMIKFPQITMAEPFLLTSALLNQYDISKPII